MSARPSARRAARASQSATVSTPIEGRGAADSVLTVLRDPDAPLWADRELYREFMTAHDWHLPASERLGDGTHPHNRRNHAAIQWAAQAGEGWWCNAHGHVDLHRLRRAGLYGEGEES